MLQLGLPGLDAKLKKHDEERPAQGSHKSILVGKNKREAVATYMGGTRWTITLKKAS